MRSSRLAPLLLAIFASPAAVALAVEPLDVAACAQPERTGLPSAAACASLHVDAGGVDPLATQSAVLVCGLKEGGPLGLPDAWECCAVLAGTRLFCWDVTYYAAA